jgi:hypothetical protein
MDSKNGGKAAVDKKAWWNEQETTTKSTIRDDMDTDDFSFY